MKKLNKKGFTLVELLAVIVILAVVMVITIPTVLGSMSNAKEKAFNAAVDSIEEFVQKNYDACKSGLGADMGVEYDNTLFGADCSLTATASQIVTAAGYDTNDIIPTSATVAITNGKFTASGFQRGGKFA